MAEGREDTELLFPLSGLNVATEFGRQPGRTTPEADNVRAFDVLARRGRGGSRPGLGRFIGDTVPAGEELIQHMNVIVDPQSPALLASGDVPGGVESAVFPGWHYRRGGSAIQPNRGVTNDNDEEGGGTSGPIAYVQGKRQQFGNVSTVQAMSLTDEPGLDNLIVVIVRTSTSGAAEVLTDSVTNANLNAFTRVGSGVFTVSIQGIVSLQSLSMWYRVASAGAPDQTVRITPGSSGIFEVIVLEYSGNSSGPVSDDQRTTNETPGTAITTNDLEMNGTTGQAVLAAFITSSVSPSEFIPGSGYTGLFGHQLGATANMVVIHKLNVSGVGPENPSLLATSAAKYGAISVALTT